MAAPAVFAFRLIGLEALTAMISGLMEEAKDQERQQWWVVSAANYALALEERDPHWQEAVEIVAAKAEFGGTTVQTVGSGVAAPAIGNLTEDLANAIAAEVKDRIHLLGLIDTGNYLSSIAVGPDLQEAIRRSRSQMILPQKAINFV